MSGVANLTLRKEREGLAAGDINAVLLGGIGLGIVQPQRLEEAAEILLREPTGETPGLKPN